MHRRHLHMANNHPLVDAFRNVFFHALDIIIFNTAHKESVIIEIVFDGISTTVLPLIS